MGQVPPPGLGRFPKLLCRVWVRTGDDQLVADGEFRRHFAQKGGLTPAPAANEHRRPPGAPREGAAKASCQNITGKGFRFRERRAEPFRGRQLSPVLAGA
jgi:hypothetical protein